MNVQGAFAKAISTIKTLTRSPNLLGRPNLEQKTALYGLYKQATEGDVQGIMPRPGGSSPQELANQRKWDAWKQNEGLDKDTAKVKYIEYLLETMRQVSPDTPQSRALLNELEAIYLMARDQPPPPISSQQIRTTPSYQQFLRRPTYSEFGLSVGDRTEQLSEVGDDWRLNRIEEEPSTTGSNGNSGGGNPNYLWVLESLYKVLSSLGQRVAVDVCALTGFLIFVRIVRKSPYLPPIVRKLFTIVGNVIAVVLREVGFDIRQIKH